MAKLLPAYWLFPIIFFIPNASVIVCKALFESTAMLTYLGSKSGFFTCLFLQWIDQCELAVIHYWCYQIFCVHFRIPSFPLNLIIAIIYLETFGFSLYDFENGRYNMQMVLVSTYRAYLGRFGMKVFMNYPPLYQIYGTKTKSNTAMNIVTITILESPKFWIGIISVFIVFVILCIWLTFKYGPAASSSFKFYVKPKQQVSSGIRPSLSMTDLVFSKTNDIIWTPDHPYLNAPFIIYHLGFFIWLLFELYLFQLAGDDKSKLFAILPYSQSMYFTMQHYESKPSKDLIKRSVNLTRSYLPKGRYWLDTRPDPVFPQVHADRKFFCAYNPNSSICSSPPTPTPEPLSSDELPNIVFIIWESFTPYAYLLNHSFIDEHVYLSPDDPRQIVTDTPMYNRDILRSLHDFSKEAVVFSAMASNGLPTLSGWHSLMTGVTPSPTFMNIIDGSSLQTDDFPSLFHDEFGYRTMYISPARFDFDGKNSWVYRRPARQEAMIQYGCKEAYGDTFNDTIQRSLTDIPNLTDCSTDSMQRVIDERTEALKRDGMNYPLWFDYLTSYYPSERQSKVLNLSYKSFRNDTMIWIPDRITAKEFQTHWKQQKSVMKEKKPILSMQLTVESHLPYSGYDSEQFYDPILPTIKPHTDQHRAARFIRVNKYSDRYLINETLQFLKENDPNTIVVLTGDHGGRDLPLREPSSKITEKVQFCGDCVHGSSGPDNLFTVSGLIGYLGNNSKVKSALGLDKLAGKTFKFGCDYNDLTYTVADIVAKLEGVSNPPTYRRSRNLIDLSLDLIEKIEKNGTFSAFQELDESHWQSISYVTFEMEYRNGSKLLRTHTGDVSGSHFYQNYSFPVCMKKTGGKDGKTGGKVAKEMYKQMWDYYAAETYYLSKNRMFNYSFRNKSCVEEGKCQYPKSGKPLHFDDRAFYFIVGGLPILFFVVIALPVETVAFIRELFMISEPEIHQLEPEEMPGSPLVFDDDDFSGSL